MEDLTEMGKGSSAESFQKLLESQKDLFHNQIDQLQKIVVTQCKLTGVNPLAQEMAAGALSINIGKRPRDLLNPKAVKYMQAVFSIKDAITKKESREISAQFGVTVTQVRDFFNGQRSRVRKLVRLSMEKANRANDKEPHDGIQSISDSSMHIDSVSLDSSGLEPLPEASTNQNTLHPNSSISNALPLNSILPNPVPLNSIEPSNSEEAPSCSSQNDMLPNLDDADKDFVGNIFSLLQKEETFSGQEKLMEWITRIHNPSVLDWFLANGGVMILATWLSQAAAEEQTSVLLVTLKVLCHLPLHRALPEHMSAILQSVNQLRFYRTSDISNRARMLVARWSKIFARAQAIKKSNGVSSSTEEQEMILKRSIDEIMSNEQLHPNFGNPENVLALSSEPSDSMRKVEVSQPLKLLPASIDDLSRKHGLGVSLSHNRARRKVQLVEQPGERTNARSPQAVKPVPVTRPMSADDIQKAKLRALHMQGKHGRTGPSANAKTIFSKPVNNSSSNMHPTSKAHVQPKIEVHRKHPLPPQKGPKIESSDGQKKILNSKLSLVELCKRVQIPWRTPSEIKLNELWRVGTDEKSKEVDVQKNRNRREMETIFWTVQEVPPNPKEPWDIEMDYDDTLTPEIPIDQPPDADDDGVRVDQNENENQVTAPIPAPSPALSLVNTVGGGWGSAAEPDLELLAVLLKNPDLVFALTSGQAGNGSTAETVKLLDMIKGGGPALATGLNSSVGKAEEKVEVSLPSPTPSSDPGTSGWKPETVRNPFSQQKSTASRFVYNNTVAGASLQQAQSQVTNLRIAQQEASVALSSQQSAAAALSSYKSAHTTIIKSDKKPLASPSLHQSLPYNPSMVNSQASETITRRASTHVAGSSLPRFSGRLGPLNHEPENIVKAAYARNNTPERRPTQPFSNFPVPAASWSRPTHRITEPELVHSMPPTGSVGPAVSDSWRGSSQEVASNSFGQFNQNNYNASMRRSMQPHLRSGPRRDRNVYVGNDGFESWSPDNSPTRSPEYLPGRNNFIHPRSNPGREYSPGNRSGHGYPSGYRDYNGSRDRRWR